MNFEQIRKENKLLMAEMAKLDLSIAANRDRQKEIIGKLNENNSDLRAIATALGPRDQMPRLFKYRQANSGVNGGKA